MPIYEYLCTDCGEEIEVIQNITDKPLKKCEKCEGKLKRLMSNNAFHLKGSGWYKTDYAPKKDKKDVKEKDKKNGTDKKKSKEKTNKTKEKSAA